MRGGARPLSQIVYLCLYGAGRCGLGALICRLSRTANARGSVLTFRADKLVHDGLFGRVREIAVQKFQAQMGLAPDGVVGSATARALGLGL
ncbi:hypothetical protein HB662_01155 [Roseomonas frigidaquae]|uniref:Peptidoglycan binding-like domain-containing protein n=1 Tax=Falsiroseomonas frigidaquae TaxID=487318 RepID=A0ABX1ES10_9PROT|nr:peptidoglycan-binding domain-containing protein [Falsiroseomonas frigidaquae]NKE43367.1 hypothetical protein [Falsiroseomonas frigidaquae]